MISENKKEEMKLQQGGLRGDVILWLIGIPIPVILLLHLLRGCK